MEHALTLLARDAVAEGTMAFRFARPAGLDFAAGQYLDVSLPALAQPDPAGNLRSFSIASAPHEDCIVLATRMRPSPFKLALAALPIGAKVQAEGAHGELVLDDAETPLVLHAGGIGITPFRAMLRDLAHRGSAREVTLLYGNRTPQAAAFMDELDALSSRLRALRVVHCMSEPDRTRPAWTGATGFLTAALITRHVPDPPAALHLVVGPPAMTAAVSGTLLDLGVPEESVRVEDFAGY